MLYLAAGIIHSALLKQTAGQRFLKEVAQTYQRSPLEITLFLLALGIPVIFLITYAAHQRRREITTWIEEAQQYFIDEAERHHLTPSQREAMYRIAELATRPWKAHEIFTAESLFNRGASRLREQHEIAEETVSALRLKLGFTRHGGVPISSAGVPVGSRIAIAREGSQAVVTGEVEAQKTSAFILKLDQEWNVLVPGKRVRVLYQTSSGVYSFLTTILKKKNLRVALRHTETVGRSQRRKYYRRAMSMPVGFALEHWSDYAQTTTVDLGGGGATVRLPEGTTVRGGEKVWLHFETLAPPRPQGGMVHPREVTAICSVARVSDRGVHLAFVSIRESLRDRIIEQLFSLDRSHSQQPTHSPSGDSVH